jgi:hypothetical protein
LALEEAARAGPDAEGILGDEVDEGERVAAKGEVKPEKDEAEEEGTEVFKVSLFVFSSSLPSLLWPSLATMPSSFSFCSPSPSSTATAAGVAASFLSSSSSPSPSAAAAGKAPPPV